MTPDLYQLPRKVRQLRHLDLSRTQVEVATLEIQLRERAAEVESYRPHKVTVAGVDYLACDAKTINRHNHQSGRGDYRYLFRDYAYAGLATHASTGYRVIA